MVKIHLHWSSDIFATFFIKTVMNFFFALIVVILIFLIFSVCTFLFASGKPLLKKASALFVLLLSKKKKLMIIKFSINNLNVYVKQRKCYLNVINELLYF